MKNEIDIAGIKIRECAWLPKDTVFIIGDVEVIKPIGDLQPNEDGNIRVFRMPCSKTFDEFPEPVRFYEPEDPIDLRIRLLGFKIRTL